MMGNNPRTSSNPMASFGRRSTDATAEEIANERAASRRRIYTTVAVLSFGAAIAIVSWQAAFTFVGIAAVIASIPTSK